MDVAEVLDLTTVHVKNKFERLIGSQKLKFEKRLTHGRLSGGVSSSLKTNLQYNEDAENKHCFYDLIATPIARH